MSSERRKHLSEIAPKFKKFENITKIGDPEGFGYIFRCLIQGTRSIKSLQALACSELGKKNSEIELSLHLLALMELIEIGEDKDEIVNVEPLIENGIEEEVDNIDWFADEFVKYVMDNDIIDIKSITYDVSSDAFLMAPSSIKLTYAGFRNMLVEFGIISMRADAYYTVLQKLDKYIAQPEVRKTITEKQLYAQLLQRKELGNKGEEWVLEYEKRRITNPALRNRIKLISLIDVGAGFDIVSFENDNSTNFDRFIEVKTFKGCEHFHWSHNEIEIANLYREHYYLYLVDGDCLNCEDYEPQIIQNPIENIGNSDIWAKRPDSYLVERFVKSQDGHQLPLFTNVENFNYPRPTIPVFQNVSPLAITAQEVRISTQSVSTSIEDLQTRKVADASEVKPASAMTDDIFKKSLEQLFHVKDFKNKECIFKKKCHWVAVYRLAVEWQIAIDKDYSGFVVYIEKLNLQDCPIKVDNEVLKKADWGVYRHPVNEWSLELYQKLNEGKLRKPFDEMNEVALKFKNILDNNM